MTLGEWLAGERMALQLSQNQLAQESGVAQSTISELESGERLLDNRALKAVRQLAETLNISALEAYQRAGLFDFSDEADRDRDAIEVALLVRALPEMQRRQIVGMLLGRGDGNGNGD